MNAQSGSVLGAGWVGVVLAGAILALTPVPPIGVVAFAALTGSDINKYKPVGLLLWEARHADAARSGAIANELIARAVAKGLAPDQYATVIHAALDLQGDPNRAWNEAWGDLIERAKLDGVLTADQEDRFDRQAMVLELKARERVHAGQTLTARLAVKSSRVATNGFASQSVSLVGATVGGLPTPAAPSEQVSLDPLIRSLMGTPAGTQDRAALGVLSASGSRSTTGMVFGTAEPELKSKYPPASRPANMTWWWTLKDSDRAAARAS